MSLTSYRAAPPRASDDDRYRSVWLWRALLRLFGLIRSLSGSLMRCVWDAVCLGCGLSDRFWRVVVRKGWKTWRRPTLPCLRTQYHGRWGFSRPSSGWDRVRAPREDHQVVQPIHSRRSSIVSCRTEGQASWGWGFWCFCVCSAAADRGRPLVESGR